MFEGVITLAEAFAAFLGILASIFVFGVVVWAEAQLVPPAARKLRHMAEEGEYSSGDVIKGISPNLVAMLALAVIGGVAVYVIERFTNFVDVVGTLANEIIGPLL